LIFVALMLAALSCLATRPAAAASGELSLDQAKEYADCMTLARRVPDQALESATAWQAAGGGPAAGHCAAVALIGLGRYKEAASAMEKLAKEEAKTRTDLAAGLWGQAGQAWLLAGDNDRGLKAQTAALALAPNDVELLADRGVTLAAMGKYWDAIDDFNRAHELARDRADILIYRASAYRLLDSLDLAREDIQEAIRLQPKNPDAYLERGVIKRLSNDPAGAKADWQQVAVLGPGTPAADAAAGYLKELNQPPP
jgi:tetratricopeptide (TPR) repeat protein